MPSAISLRRFSIAPMTGGQIHFMQNQTKTIIAIVCPISVRLKSIELSPAISRRRRSPACSCPMNGLAKAKKSAMPTPIIATASSSATTMNIFVCSIGASSGWRAAPSRKRPPSRPMPMPTPSAPRPMRIATAIAVNPITVSIERLLVKNR